MKSQKRINMKKLFCFLLLFSAYFSYGQENAEKTPERVIIANGEIITIEQLNELDMESVKSMNNGVSDERRAELFEKFGDKIGPKEFIFEVILWTEDEMKEIVNARSQAPPPPPPPQPEVPMEQTYILNVNDKAADFVVQMIDRTTIKLSDLKGQVVLLNFWATWCAPCIREFHEFPSKIVEPFKNTAFVLLPVSRGETMEVVKDKMAELKNRGIDFNVGIDPDRAIYDLYATEYIPKNFLIDKNGIIRYTSTGYTEEGLKEIVSMIQELLDEDFVQEVIEELTDEFGHKSLTKIIFVSFGLLIVAVFAIVYILRKRRR
jgi:peroxiredoxin